MRSSKLLMAALALVVAMALPTASLADVVNGGFETGNYSGWSTSGNNSVVTTAPVPEGTWHSLSSTSGGVSIPTLESFFGLGAGALAALGNGNPTQGSGIQQTIATYGPNETITFQYNFATNETAFDSNPASFNDFAFLVVDGVAYEIADTGSPLGAGSFGFDSSTGVLSYTFTIPSGGNHTVGFGVVDVADTGFNSALSIDNVVYTPEPATLAVFGLMGLVGAGYGLRRRRKV